jgi:hypothetical protein
MQLVIVPRWGGTRASDFYPWLIEQLPEMQARVVDLLPEPNAPEPAPTVDNLCRAIVDPTSTILLAHSVGCRAALEATRRLDAPLRALLCVAGWFHIDEPWPSILPWLDEDLGAEPRVGALSAIISDNDPFTADHAATRARFERLGAEVTLVPGARHFNEREEPAVLQALRALGA